MITKAGKKILATMMALILVFGNVPAIAFAASAETNPLQDGTLTVTYEGEAVEVDEANGVVRVDAVPTGGDNPLDGFKGVTTTATLTNQSEAEQILSFDYSVQGNLKEMTIGGEGYTGTSTWSGVVEAGTSVDVVLSGNDTDGLVKTAMGNFAFHNSMEGKMVYLEEAVNGTATGENDETIFKTTYEAGATVSAVPDAGYQFVAWVDENNQILSTEANTTLHPVVSCNVTAVFADADTPYFKAAGKLFTDLNEAAAYASECGTGVVVPMKDATIPAGDYTIPAGVTLLVPFDAAETCYLDKAQTAGIEFVEPETYCKLTFAAGANLTVNGELSVSAKHTSGFNSTKTGGTPTESVGMIDLKEGSTITITDGASAYAWGYIIGSGNMIAESGATIYENRQIADFRGGSQTLNLLSTPVLPFSQYYIQNIEAPLTLHGGATEYVISTMSATMSGLTITSPFTMKFVGSEDALFCLDEGSTVIKSYDSERDRLALEFDGDFVLNSFISEMMGQRIDTRGYNYPINNNISINIHSGTAVINQNLALQPGVELSVAEGATVKIANGTNLYIYDKDEWGAYTFGGAQFVDIAYSPTKNYTRTVENDIKDVVLDINGHFVVEGAVYTTSGGAQVISSEDTGAVEFKNTAGPLAETKQADGTGTLVAIPITPVKLQNPDGSYVETSAVAVGDGFVSDNGKWIPATDVTLTYDANGGTIVGDSSTQVIPKQNVLLGTKISLRAATNVVSKDGYVFKDWNTKADGSGTSYADREALRLVKDTILYAQWDVESYTLTFLNHDNSVIEKITAPFGTQISAPVVPHREGYLFKWWSSDVPTTMPAYDQTFKALWTPIDYTITFDTDGGSAVAPMTAGYNTVIKEPAAPTKEGYTFTGWEPAFPEKMPLGGMELKATWQLTKNTISFETDGGSEVADIKGYYGDAVIKPADPTKEGYTFIGWDQAFPETMPAKNLTLTAQWKINQYSIIFDTDGGSEVAAITADYGSKVTAPAAPTKEGYTFTGWDAEIPETMPAKNLFIRALWKSNTPNLYTITFYVDREMKEVLQKVTVAEGETPEPVEPKKDSDEYYRYEFAGWNRPLNPAYLDESYYATWKSVEQYSILFLDWDGNEVLDKPLRVDKGTDLSNYPYVPMDLKRASDDEYDYTFTGWEPALSTSVTKAETYKAQYEATKAIADINLTFAVGANGSYTVNGEKITEQTTIKETTAERNFVLKATPDKGYEFLGWYKGSTYISGDAEYTYRANSTKTTITPKFMKEGTAKFMVDGNMYGGLTNAITAATKVDSDGERVNDGVMVLMNDATLQAGTYTIPAGTTLLIPHDEKAEVYRQKPGYVDEEWVEPTAYRTLTLGKDAKLKVEGELSVTAPHVPGAGGRQNGGSPHKAYGQIVTETGAEISLSKGAALYAYGYITGKGSVEAQSGATVYEYFQVMDFRGGSATTDMITAGIGYGVSPLSQYYVQNIEVPLTLEAGSNEFCYTSLKRLGNIVNLTIGFIGEDQNMMFKLHSGSATKTYDGTKDRLIIEINGDFDVSPREINGATEDINSGALVLPINSNISIYVNSGSINISQDVAFIPGTELVIAKGAGCTLADDCSIYVYDQDTWGKYCATGPTAEMVSLNYAPGKSYTRTTADLKDAVLRVDGTLDATKGYLYTTKGGANIHSTGEGKITLRKGTEEHTYQFEYTGPPAENQKHYGIYHEIEITPPVLQNGDSSYVETGDMAASENYIYINGTWIPNEEKCLSFFDVDGTLIKSIVALIGAPVVAPENPIREGHTFAGWDKEVPETMPAEDMTITAKWNVNKYTITFDTAGGSEVKAITEDYGTEVKAPAAPVRAGYTFAGWDVEIPETMPAENMTITAKWTINQYTIKFDTAGGSKIDPITQDYNSKVKAPADPVREGYTFAGWNVEIPETMPAKNVTVTAKWTINQYTIKFDTTGGSEVASITQDYNSKVETPADPEREGYTFAGWDVKIPETMPAKNMTVTAKWTVNKYTITFDTAGGSEVESITQDYGTDVTAPADPVKEGYTFAGWDVEIPETMPAENVKITAQWTVNKYTITFDTAGGSEVESITQDYGTDVTAPADPVKEGYTFAGWDVKIPETMPAGNMTATAQWTVNKYTITFDTAGGSEVKAITQDYATAVKAPADPTREGYTFAGWDVQIPETMPAESMKITAKWTVNQYTITVDSANGTESVKITQNYGTAVTAPADPVREGYTFAGWDVEIPETMPAQNMTATAQWKINQYTITFDTAGGNKIAPITEDYATVVKAPAAPAKEGYTFAGWDVEIPETMPAKNLTIKATYTKILDTPTLFVTTDLEKGMNFLVWSAIEDSAEYDVYRSSKKDVGFVKIATIREPSYIDNSITEGNTYNYYVIAVHGKNKNANSANSNVISATYHDVVIDLALDPTCTETGLTEGSHCGICNETILKQQSVKALGHDWSDATCTEPKICKICGETEGKELGHDWKVATCYTPKTCKTCGETEGKALDHDWKAATCDAPKTCKLCGTIDGKTLNHDWKAATCDVPKTCKLCGEAEGKALDHDWKVATCDAPKTCKLCGTIEGKALEHDWKVATCDTPKTCKLCGTVEGKALNHDWKVATCDIPKTCKTCGETEGKALDHDWKAATCDAPKTCRLCSTVEGKALDHEWTAATCEAPKTCKACSATEGSALGHDYQDVVTKKATTTKDGKITETCSVCGDVAGTTVIRKASKISLSTSSYTYTGGTKSPKVYVKDSKGKTISSKNYKVTTPTGRKSIGTYTYKITFKEQYSGSKTLTLTIKPKTTTIKTPSVAKKAITVKWTKGSSSQVSGYEILLATNSKFTKGKKTVTVKGYKTTSKKVTKLKSKTKYYVKVRTYKTVKGKKVYSDWSKVKTVRTK